MPNAGDKVFQRMAHGTTSLNLQTPLTNPATGQGIVNGIFRLVFSRTIEVISTGNGIATYTDAHNLGYVPMALAALNNASLADASGTVNNASLFLPTFLNASIGGVTAGVITFGSYLFHFVDDENVYINLLNDTGSLASAFVTYYLYQQAATG